jgi:hypothetical protein
MSGTDAIVPQPGPRKPGVAQVRLVGPPEVIDAALALLDDLCGDAWQPSTRKPGRHAGGDELVYGTLIVPVSRAAQEPADG